MASIFQGNISKYRLSWKDSIRKLWHSCHRRTRIVEAGNKVLSEGAFRNSGSPFAREPALTSDRDAAAQPYGHSHIDLGLLHDYGRESPQRYSQLIAKAILKASNQRLTLSGIFEWLSDHYFIAHRILNGGRTRFDTLSHVELRRIEREQKLPKVVSNSKSFNNIAQLNRKHPTRPCWRTATAIENYWTCRRVSLT